MFGSMEVYRNYVDGIYDAGYANMLDAEKAYKEAIFKYFYILNGSGILQLKQKIICRQCAASILDSVCLFSVCYHQ